MRTDTNIHDDILERMRHQAWRDPDRLSIEIDCPPGLPRPPEVFRKTIRGTGLRPKDFVDRGVTWFGYREYLIRADPDRITRYLLVRVTIGERLKKAYELGIIRGATW